MRCFRYLALVMLLAVGTTTLAADWPRFRGPNGGGIVDDPTIPLKWSQSSNMAWTIALPGSGNSSPIIVKDKLFVQSSTKDGTQRMLLCLNANTGVIEWSKTHKAHKAHTHVKNSLASSTPASDGDRVYTIMWDGSQVSLVTYDFAGKELWTVVLGGYISQHGPGMSPVAFGGNVYVNYDQDGEAQFVCFDGKSGKKKWSAERKPFRACYSSPLIRDIDGGKKEIINASTAGITGYDPESGKLNWNWDWQFDGMALRTVGSPILAGDTVVAVSGDGGGSRCTVAVTAGAGSHMLWEKKKDTPYVPGPLLKDEHLYWITDAGMATCAELKSGKIVWSERAFSKPVSSSPILLGDNILTISEDGKAVLFKATPQGYDKVADNEFGEPVFSSPAVANGRLYVRGAEHLFCIMKK